MKASAFFCRAHGIPIRPFRLRPCLALVASMLGTAALHAAPTVVTFSTAGSGNWTAPAWVTEITIETWGGGGGGGGDASAGGPNNNGAGGGGGGAYARVNTVSVTPGGSYGYTVGAAGTAGAISGGNGGAGGNSSFNTTTCVAAGGLGGTGGNSGAGGAGGTIAASTGDVKYAGGSGATGAAQGGGGGGSGGTGSNGNSVSGQTGATAVMGGGPGGNGGNGGTGAAPSSGPGGGGGGGDKPQGGSNVAGGAGRAGQVRITYKSSPGVTAWPTATAIEYGQALSASTLSGGAAAAEGSFAFTAPATVPAAAGTVEASVTFTPEDTESYATVHANIDLEVSPRAITVTAVTDAREYDGTTDSAGTPTLTSGSLIDGDSATWTQTFDTRHVGTGKSLTPAGVVDDGNGGANYAVTFVPDTTGTITARPLTVSAVSDSKVYDGNTTSAGTPILVSGTLVPGDTGNWTQTFDTPDVGTDKTLTPQGAIDDSNGGNNYAVTFVSVNTGTISATALIPLTVTATADDKGYDGLTDANVSLADDRVDGDDLTVNYTAATFADPHAGDGKTVTVIGLSLAGPDADKYALTATEVEATADIAARPITVTAVTDTKEYDGSSTSVGTPSVTPGSLAVGDTAVWSQAFADKHAGVGKALIPTGVVEDGNGGANYDVTWVQDNTGVIQPLALLVLVTADSKVYDGSDAATLETLELDGVLGADAVSLTGGTATFEDRNVDIGKTVTVTGLGLAGADAVNYTVSPTATAQADISEKTLTVTGVTASDKTYDGTPDATVDASGAVLSGAVDGDAVALDTTFVAGLFASANVGAGQEVTVFGLALTGSDAGNYTLTSPVLFADIDARSVEVSGTRVYDGTAVAAAEILTIVNSVDGADVQISGSVALAGSSVGAHAVSAQSVAELQWAAGNNNNGATPFSVSLGAAPTAGNTLVAVISTRGTSADRISGITQAGATWSRVAQGVNGDGTTTEIWYAPHVMGAGTSLSIALAGTMRAAAVVAEYRGVLSAGAVDQFADDDGSGTTARTGITPVTAQANELWIGGIGLASSSHTLTGIANGFVEVGSAASTGFPPVAGNNAKVYALRRIATATGAAGSEGTIPNSNWSGAIATFRAVPTGLDGPAAGNYTLVGLSGSVTITGREATVNGVSAVDKTYDGTTATALETGAAALVGVLAGDAVALDATGATGAFADADVGADKPVSISGLALTGGAAGNYALTQPSSNADIFARPITVTADAQSKPYGEADPALTWSITSGSLAGGDAIGGALSRVVGDDVGIYAIQQGTLSAGDNYALVFAGANLTIAARDLVVTADAQVKTYGEAEPALTWSITSGSLVDGDAIGGALSRVAGENVGIYAIQQGTLSAGDNYALVFAGANLTIAPRDLVVTADAQAKTYGEADPALTWSITSGLLVGGDTIGGALSRVAGEDVGIYAIQQGTLSAGGNYDLVFAGANLTIASRAITVRAVENNKVYDGTTASGGLPEITSGSLAAGDTADWTQTFDTKHVGADKTLTPSGTVDDGNDGDNYTITFVAVGSGTITAKPITVTADAQSREYGDADPALTWSLTTGALADGDALAGALFRVAGEALGVYAIEQGTLSADSNYTLTFVGANLTIAPRAITVTADAQFREYGAADPALTWALTSGSLVGGDTIAGALERVAGEGVGVHAIQQGSLNAGSNYALTFVGANLTITPRALTVTADAQSKIYGEVDPALTWEHTAGTLLDGDAIGGAPDRVAGEAVGVYAIQQGSLSAGANYTLTFVGADLTITPRALTVTADAQSREYGEDDPALTWSLTLGALVGDDEIAGALVRVPGNNVGAYAIQQGTLDAGVNYALTFEGANLTILPRDLTVSAVADSKSYDGTTASSREPVVTAGSLVPGDTGNWTQTFDSPAVGTGKTLTPAGSVDDGNAGANYSVTFVANTFGEITALNLTVTGITAEDKVYDGTTAATLDTTGASLVGVSVGDDVTLDTTSATGTFASRNAVADQVVTVSGLTLAGADAGAYALMPVVTEASISPRPIQVSGARGYDGTYEATADILTIENNVDGADLALVGSLTLANRTVGTHPASVRTVARIQAATGAAGGAASSVGVTLGSAPVSGNSLVALIATRESVSDRVSSIVQAGANWSRVAQVVNSDGATTEVWHAPNAVNAASLVTVNLAMDLRVAIAVMEYRGALSLGAPDRTATATGSGTAVTTGVTPQTSQGDELWIGAIGHRDSGITLGTPGNGFAKVVEATPSDGPGGGNLKLHGLEKIVDAAAEAFTGGTLSAAKTWAAAVTTFRTSPTRLAGPAAGNYTLTGLSGSVTITGSTLTVSATALNRTYDGTALATVVFADNRVEGDDLTVTSTSATFDTRHAGVSKTVTVSGLGLTGPDAGNYQLATPGLTAQADIAPMGLTVTAVSDSKLYDGSTDSAGLPLVTAGSVAPGDVATWSQTFDTPELGTGKTLTPAGAIDDGNGGLNYTITFEPVHTGVIEVNVPAVLAFVVEPGAAEAGAPFGVQPVVVTRDAYGHASTLGLPASLLVTISMLDGAGLLQGTTTLDIGTGAGNGTVSFTDLRTETAGVGKQLIAEAAGLTDALSALFDVDAEPAFDITDAQAEAPDVFVSVDATAGKHYRVLAASDIDGVYAPIFTTNAVGPFVFGDAGFGLVAPAKRFYRVVQDNGVSVTTNAGIVAAYSRPMPPSSWQKLAMPGDFGAENTLGRTVGDQLKDVLAGGALDDGDILYVQDAAGGWLKVDLDADRNWRTNGVMTDLSIPATEGFWIRRRALGVTTNAVFAAPVATSAPAVTFPAQSWRVIAWPFARARAEADGATAPERGWGFAAAGAQQGSSWLNADNLIVGSGAAQQTLWLKTDGRWYRTDGTAASAELEAGEAYYYRHRGAGFTWTAQDLPM